MNLLGNAVSTRSCGALSLSREDPTRQLRTDRCSGLALCCADGSKQLKSLARHFTQLEVKAHERSRAQPPFRIRCHFAPCQRRCWRVVKFAVIKHNQGRGVCSSNPSPNAASGLRPCVRQINHALWVCGSRPQSPRQHGDRVVTQRILLSRVDLERLRIPMPCLSHHLVVRGPGTERLRHEARS